MYLNVKLRAFACVGPKPSEDVFVKAKKGIDRALITFAGLKQVLYDHTRVRIQKTSPHTKTPYQYIKHVRFTDHSGQALFSNQPVHFSPDLNAIIGGKSSGKSLLLYHMACAINRVISEKVVRRLMAEEQLVVKCTRRRRYNSYCGEIGPAPENLLARDFSSCRPNEKWLTDITEFQLPAGKVYLSPVIDCFDGQVVSWSIGTRPDATLVNTMLDEALDTLNEHYKPVIHSDRGGHYRWPGWLDRINTSGLIRSMSRKGCSSDNAACEGFFGRIKNEMFYGRNWADITLKNLSASWTGTYARITRNVSSYH